jgi:two-component system, NarL family, sensor kinase
VATQQKGKTTADARIPIFSTETGFTKILDSSSSSIRKLLVRFVLAGFLALILVSAVTAFASSKVGNKRAIVEAQNITRVVARGVIQTNASDVIVSGDANSPEYTAALQELNKIVTDTVVNRGAFARVKLWTKDGTIVYSDDSRLIRRNFPLGEDELAIFDGAKGVAGISDLSEPENALETEKKLVQVYELTRTKQGTPLLFEAYFKYDDVRAVGVSLWGQFAPIAIGSLVLLELIQIPIAVTLARRLRAGQAQRERLLRHAIEASEMERRRIAGDLHDGVVQDLTGVSLSLTAASWVGGPDAPAMAEASSKLRDGIKSLRSLLVDIYPPNLHEEGLESALGDLLGGLANRGLHVHLVAELNGADLPPDVVRLLYRTAQEALRNVVNHAGASNVRIALSALDDVASIVIDDDGKGFTADRMADRVDEGHVGLRGLVDLVAEAGGQLSVLSAVDGGTRVEAKLPYVAVPRKART